MFLPPNLVPSLCLIPKAFPSAKQPNKSLFNHHSSFNRPNTMRSFFPLAFLVSLAAVSFGAPVVVEASNTSSTLPLTNPISSLIVHTTGFSRNCRTPSTIDRSTEFQLCALPTAGRCRTKIRRLRQIPQRHRWNSSCWGHRRSTATGTGICTSLSSSCRAGCHSEATVEHNPQEGHLRRT
jgi:hypothetical protein